MAIAQLKPVMRLFHEILKVSFSENVLYFSAYSAKFCLAVGWTGLFITVFLVLAIPETVVIILLSRYERS